MIRRHESEFAGRNLARRNQGGFTLIEMLVVISITALMTGFLIAQFSHSQTGVSQITAVIESELRDTQTRAIAGVKFQSKHRCGYGVKQIDGHSFSVYTTADASDTSKPDCSVQNRNYEGTDVIVRTVSLPDPKIEIKDLGQPYIFRDIFFEPPLGKTYINNDGSASAVAGRITIGAQNVVCLSNPGSCKSICIYSSGKMETVVGVSCP
ncbi:MAG: prepilin-type N-terminal cleavage/methylation domain-containing protein [Patescibacteria group bacterium]